MSSPAIELAASQALFSARMLATAVHDLGPWSFLWGGIEVPAVRTVTDDGVVFTGEFPEVCYLSQPDDGLLLLCDGDIMGIRRPQGSHPGDTGFVVTWAVLAKHRQGASH